MAGAGDRTNYSPHNDQDTERDKREQDLDIPSRGVHTVTQIPPTGTKASTTYLLIVPLAG